MAGEVVALKKSTEEHASEETKRTEAMRAWADDLACKVIKAVLEDAALRFLDDIDDEEQVDLQGEYDPIINEKTGARLSDAIQEFAPAIKRPERMLRRIYLAELKRKWQQGQWKIPTDPQGQAYGAYLVNRHGIWIKLRVNAGRRPTAMSRDTTRQRNWRHHYRITDETGEFDVEIGNEHLAKKADRAIRTLMQHGVHVIETADARQHLAKFLRYKPRARIIRAPMVGWFEPRKNSWVFVLPGETLGDGRLNVTLDTHGPSERHGFHRSGTSEQWRQEIAAPLAKNSNVVLAVGIFLAAPLLRWAGEPGGGFNFHGPAKTGKTLIGTIGQSIWGKPYKPGAGADAFGFTWESTANRLGERAVLRSDIGLYLDEIGIGDQKDVASTVYKLAAGLDKGRFGRAESDFNILFLSTGEPSLAEFLPNARPGQLIRLVDIPAVVQSESAFETICKEKIAAAGRQFYAATSEFHGSVGYDWLCHLVTLGPKQIKAELNRLRDIWQALPQVTEIAGRAHPQVVSVINRFALVAAALNMAAAAGIVPWAVTDIDAAIIACMQRWLGHAYRPLSSGFGPLIRSPAHQVLLETGIGPCSELSRHLRQGCRRR